MYDSTVATMNVSDARNHLLDAMETARTETVFLQRRGRLAGVLVSPERYEQLIGALEDAEDVAAFDAAMAEEGPTSHGIRSNQTSAGSEPVPNRAPSIGGPLSAQARSNHRRRIQGAIALLAPRSATSRCQGTPRPARFASSGWRLPNYLHGRGRRLVGRCRAARTSTRRLRPVAAGRAVQRCLAVRCAELRVAVLADGVW